MPFADQFFVFCLSPSSSLAHPFFFFLHLNLCAAICEVSRTMFPVCILQLAVVGIKCGMYGTWFRVSGEPERRCPSWQGPQIYGVDVSLHLWATDEKIPLFFFSQTPSLTLNVPLHSHSFSLLDPSCMTCCGTRWAVGLHEGVAVWSWW